MKRKIYLALTLLVLGLCVTASAFGKGASSRFGNFKELVEAAKSGKTQVDKDMIARIDAAYAEKPDATANIISASNMTGTWYMTVPIGPNPEDVFNAYQTFGNDGTMSETSSILGTLVEGPAHGVWEVRGRYNILTFELFAFDQSNGGVVAGRYRVRCVITLNGRDNLSAETAFDIIELDGTVIPNVGSGPFSGTRVQLLGL